MEIFDTTSELGRAQGLRAAVSALRGGRLVVLPTDTVYGVGADAFTPRAVAALLAAKGRGPQVPVPVLIGSIRMLDGVAYDLSATGRSLVEAFWPGPLTLVVRHPPHLAWDLGETRGTVAVRMPLHELALELIGETGPLAVSSANRTGAPPATTAAAAMEQLGESVEVYLDAGTASRGVPSTIVDVTADPPRLLRAGPLGLGRLREVAGDLVDPSVVSGA
ncbi:MAG: L-threonylcarbamoyladenylate synthase [Mycobacteriales bacterium]